MQRKTKRYIDYGLYLFISLSVVGSMFISTALNIPPAEYMRYFGLICATLVIFGFVIGNSKVLWGKKIFWIIVGSVFVLHCCIFTLLAIGRVNFSGFSVMVIVAGEIFFINALKKMMGLS